MAMVLRLASAQPCMLLHACGAASGRRTGKQACRHPRRHPHPPSRSSMKMELSASISISCSPA